MGIFNQQTLGKLHSTQSLSWGKLYAGLKKVTNIRSAAVVVEWGSRTERGAVQLQRRRRCCRDSCSALCALTALLQHYALTVHCCTLHCVALCCSTIQPTLLLLCLANSPKHCSQKPPCEMPPAAANCHCRAAAAVQCTCTAALCKRSAALLCTSGCP